MGVAQEVLSRWLRAVRIVEGMAPSPNPKKKWTGAEKLRVVSEARGLSETDLGALLRRERLHATELAVWRPAAGAALSEAGRRAAPSAESRRIHELERELRRKNAG